MQIDLTDEEKTWVAEIQFDQSKVHDHEHWKQNSEIAYDLIRSLLERRAIPAHRLKYFIDPYFNPGGRGKSRKDRFLENAGSYEDMYRHNHFLAYLRYFILGPDLPPSLMEAFGKAVKACGPVTSGDVDPLRKKARALARQYALNTADADRFYQLALETMGASSYAEAIYRAVKDVR
ncbi:MAG: hypothetical protein ABS58_09355 [Mesorhizobium sp. SCN 65-20]|nr:MAG: hypothetical protein ABS58_09355 [Mesorhizobium sp. SCN 65-20]